MGKTHHRQIFWTLHLLSSQLSNTHTHTHTETNWSIITQSLYPLALSPSLSHMFMHVQTQTRSPYFCSTFPSSESLPSLHSVAIRLSVSRRSSPLGDLEQQLPEKWLKYKVNMSQPSWLSIKWGDDDAAISQRKA